MIHRATDVMSDLLCTIVKGTMAARPCPV